MKLINILLLTLILATINARSQQDSQVTEFENTSTDKALLLFLGSNEPPERSIQMMRSAVRNERYDLLSLIFKEHNGFSKALDALQELSESSIKDKSVLVLLRTDSAFWYRPPPPFESDLSRGVQFDNAIEPFVGVIKKYLPSLAINEELFSTKTKRLKLAAQLEAKINGEVSTTMAKRPERRALPSDNSEIASEDGSTKGVPITQSPNDKKSSAPSKRVSVFALALATLVFVTLIWMIIKKKRTA